MTAPIGGNDEDEKSGKSISYLLFNVPNGKCSKYLLIILFVVSEEGLEYFLLKKEALLQKLVYFFNHIYISLFGITLCKVFEEYNMVVLLIECTQ